MLDEECTIWSYLLCFFSPAFFFFLCLRLTYSPLFSVLKHCQSVSSFRVRVQVSHLYKIGCLKPGEFSMKLVHSLFLKYPWLFWKRCILSDLHSLNRKSPLADVCSQALERHLEMALDADHRCLSSSGSESSLPPLSTVQVCTVKCWWKLIIGKVLSHCNSFHLLPILCLIFCIFLGTCDKHDSLVVCCTLFLLVCLSSCCLIIYLFFNFKTSDRSRNETHDILNSRLVR